MPDEIDFRKGTHGLHHIPNNARVFLAQLKRDIEINEGLK